MSELIPWHALTRETLGLHCENYGGGLHTAAGPQSNHFAAPIGQTC